MVSKGVAKFIKKRKVNVKCWYKTFVLLMKGKAFPDILQSSGNKSGKAND